MDEKRTVIRVDNVGKEFLLPHEKTTSIKSHFTKVFSKGGKKEHQVALKNISFDVKEGEFFGIVGRNGSGKSTLLKILASIYQPSSGTTKVEGRLVPFIELGVGFNPELTGRDNVYLNGALLGFSKSEIDAMYDEIVQFAELERFMDQKLKNYSSGMQVRLAFSMATRSNADILLIDEVLAVGDADFQRKCFEYFKNLKKNNKTVVFVTHDMNAVKEFCDRVVLIDDSVMKFIGEPAEAATEYSLLFIDDSKIQKNSEGKSKRWGNSDMRFTDVTSKIVKDEIIITARVIVNKTVDTAVYGMHITSMDGKDITATNNRLIQVEDIKDLAAGSEVEFTWKVLNIFSDGKYFITLTLVGGTSEVFDWYTDASWFEVKRISRSVTPVLPPIQVTTRNVKKGLAK